MLQTVHFDGFKNLNNISVDLEPGLNVIVGPNGIGKSNILQGFEFISNLVNFKLKEIPEKMGVKNVEELFWNSNFSSQGIDNKVITNNVTNQKKIMNIALKGCSEVLIFDPKQGGIKKEVNAECFIGTTLNYEYRCSIEYNNFDQIPLTYTMQFANFRFETAGEEGEVESQIGFELKNGNFDLNSMNSEIIEGYIGQSIDTLLKSIKNASSDSIEESLLGILSKFFFPVVKVIEEVNFGKSYKISAEKIRNSEKIFNRARLGADGSGLFSTLVYLKKNDLTKFDHVVENLKKISNQIIDFSVPIDVEPNQIFSISVKLKPELHSDLLQEIRIEQLSDGLLKWFSLVTAIKLSEKYLIFDEPEIHLDTEMHFEFIDLFRNEFRKSDRIGIMTTHNETLVNELEPDELIVINSNSGELVATRIKDLERMKEDMLETGFSLGWYYHTRAVDSYLTPLERELENE